MSNNINSEKGMGFIIGASSVGTLIEWYDFYIFGMLATIISKQFFPEDSGTSALLSTLAIFAAGFIVRPFGALVFGRLGDLIGRKYTFLLTLILMGGSTFAIGLVPGFKTIGWAAPILVLVLRLIQGLALGGEYGGAATYVAEHAPAKRRGYWTSWIQTTATLGLFLALGIILFIRNSQGVEQFSGEWGGWRYPFWISLLLVIVSIVIRMRMSESPMFAKVKAEGKTSVNPLKESFGHRANFKMVLLALFGAVMGQGVVWYTGQFYAQTFIENICKVNFVDSRNILMIAILFATPFFVVFGALSDKVGRKWIMLIGMLLAVFSYRFVYQTFLDYTNVAAKRSMIDVSKTTKSDAVATFDAKDKKKALISVKYDSVYTDGAVYSFTKTDTLHFASDYAGNTASIAYIIAKKDSTAGLDTVLVKAKAAAGVTLPEGVTYIAAEKKSAKPGVVIEKSLDSNTFWKMVGWVFILILFVTMVYGPMAAFLVELFPTKIRYTSMSLPYHIGNGVFGGLVPFLGTLIVEFTKTKELPGGDPLAGLWYPIGIAALCFVIGAIYLRNHIDEDVMD
ncbi:MAG: MFS transporter [Chitinophagaceae bacterium]|nr:MFS transporter [Chitinophagaceae bacterium]MBK7308192.1 MFS transporter [Chitinophagaceae bacterium]MBK8785772.1 MFS transporter [Chitinophagaceae bacterium]MBK9487260.1 MFS transporter [Chitinophagaceae bacterium]MBL0199648.1 MFS transporter [Chitinophagaceae bacterium]